MTPPDRWREAAREIRQAMKDADLVWSLISEGKLTGMLRRLFPAREERMPSELGKLIDSVMKLHHWHDWGRNNEGMVVSAEIVREIWEQGGSL